MAVYTGNDLDTTTVDDLSGKLINKVVGQVIESKVFDDKFGVFTRHMIDEAGNQLEEVECANLEIGDFDKTGAGWLTRKQANLKALYYKKSYPEKVLKTTVSARQVAKSCLSMENATRLGDKLVTELYNSSAINDFDRMYELFEDVLKTQKNMPVCDLNGNSDPDSLIKTIQILADNMTMPRSDYNFLGFKREFNAKEDLVLIMDSSTKARMNVDSLAGAFNMDKKNLVSNIIVLDKMPAVTYNAEKSKAGIEITIGDAKTIKMHKLTQSASDGTVTGTLKMILLNKKAIIRDPYLRKVTSSYNGEGDFYNYFLHKGDMLSYSPLRNAIALVD